MAWEIPGQVVPAEASADLSTKQFFAVVMNSSGQVAVAGAGVKCYGVLQNKPNLQGRAAAIMLNGITKGRAGAAIAAGAGVEINSSGKFITLASGTRVGTAVEAAANADDLFPLRLEL